MLMFITAGLVWVGFVQICTSHRQLRAYVFIGACGVSAANAKGVTLAPTAPLVDGTKPIALLKIENNGQTPAYDVQIFGKMDLVAWPIRDADLSALDFDDTKVTKTAIGPGKHTNKYEVFTDDSRVLKAPEGQQLWDGKLAVVVHGEIRYRDAFGKRRWTKYRLFTGGAIGIRGNDLAHHEVGNVSN
jgi:hypothetical protein